MGLMQLTVLLYNEYIILNEVIQLYLKTTIRFTHQDSQLRIVTQLVIEHHQQVTHCQVSLQHN
jgi:hypothetical protein